MPKSLSRKNVLQNSDCCVPVCLPRLIRVPRYRSHRVRNIRTCIVCKPHQSPHQLAKKPITHGFILVDLLEFHASRKRGIPRRKTTSNLAAVFLVNAFFEIVKVHAPKPLETQQPAYHPNSPRLLIAARMFSLELIAPSLKPSSKYAYTNVNYSCYGSRPRLNKLTTHASAGLCDST